MGGCSDRQVEPAPCLQCHKVENLGDFDHYRCSRNCHHFQIHFNHSNNYFHVNNDEHYDISDKDNYDNDDTILPLLLHLQIAQKLEWRCLVGRGDVYPKHPAFAALRLCQRVMAEGGAMGIDAFCSGWSFILLCSKQKQWTSEQWSRHGKPRAVVFRQWLCKKYFMQCETQTVNFLAVLYAFARPRAVCRRLPVDQHVFAARWLQRL